MSEYDLARLRMRAQRLAALPEVKTDVALVVKELGGIQAQEVAAAALQVRARSRGLTTIDVDYARVHERTIIRTWGPRGTLHLLATEDIDWLLAVYGPVFVAGGKRRRVELGLDEELCNRAIRDLKNILANQGPLTRDELVVQLASRDIHLEGQARAHLLSRAALEGAICLGPERDGDATYVLLGDWVKPEQGSLRMREEAAYTELSRRYLSAYGPATPQDQAAWSGLPLSKIRDAWQNIEKQLMEVKAGEAPAWMLKRRAAWLDKPPLAKPIVRLLPRFDIYLLGYHNRDLAVPRQHAKRINAGGGILHPTVLVGGRVVGTWKSKQKKGELTLVVEPFDPLASEVYAGVKAEAADIGRFLGVGTRLEIK